LPTIDGASAPGGDPASLAAVLPPLGCGAPTTASGGDGVVTLLAYAPSGSITDAAITPDVRADLARRGAALDIEELSPAICAIRAVTAKAGQDEAAGVSLAGVADDARAVLYDGEELVVDVAPAYEPRYVAVDYVVHTGQVWHLHPARGDDRHLPAGQALRLGDGSSGPAWQVGAPFGEDLILVTVARTPFGADRQPADEPVEAYRTRLEQRLHGSSGAPVQVFARIVETRAR